VYDELLKWLQAKVGEEGKDMKKWTVPELAQLLHFVISASPFTCPNMAVCGQA